MNHVFASEQMSIKKTGFEFHSHVVRHLEADHSVMSLVDDSEANIREPLHLDSETFHFRGTTRTVLGQR